MIYSRNGRQSGHRVRHPVEPRTPDHGTSSSATGSVPWGSIGYVRVGRPLKPSSEPPSGVDVNGAARRTGSRLNAPTAYRAGLRRLDVLLSFNRQRTRAREDLETLDAPSPNRRHAGARRGRDAMASGSRSTIPVESRSEQHGDRDRDQSSTPDGSSSDARIYHASVPRRRFPTQEHRHSRSVSRRGCRCAATSSSRSGRRP